MKWPSFDLGDDESNRLSPRVVAPGQPVPKGGGHYKVGAPYHIKGKRFVPREVSHYEETGVASWYGELFHGRRTANGEVYDMEALSAAHPTLPLPSYVQVTNLRNGRSVVLRVNDRGPYARGRLIDLSWAAASLLKMQKTGTAPVRVEYIGRAPLDGNDRYERNYLAQQRWAGPQIAYAASPGKAALRFRSLRAQAENVNRASKMPLSVASLSEKKSLNASATATKAGPPLPVARPYAFEQNRIEQQKIASGDIVSVPMLPSLQTSPEKVAYYIQAGRFDQKPLADKLAAILGELAPASVETSRNGTGFVHLIRLGPFTESNDAQIAVTRLHAAGLKEAYVEKFKDS